MERKGRGALIVVEGLDRAGKSTQCEKLCTNLEKTGRQVKYMKFPDRSTPIGQAIDAYLKGQSEIEDHVVHLLFSANRWEAAAKMRAEIARGVTLVIDRYSYSGVVYSVAKSNPQLDVHWAWQPEVGLPRPDLLLFLHVQPEVAALRGGYGAERYESGELQSRVRNLFETLIRQGGFENAVSVDAGQTPEEVEREISAVVENHILGIQSNHPLGSFGPLASTEHRSAPTRT